jgi:membrane protease YdiL (CAAX protease family)
MEKIALLVLEFAAIFVVVPLLLYFRWIPNAPIPFLLALALAAWLMLRHDPGFDSAHLSNVNAASRNLGPVLLRSAALCAILGLGVWRFAPDLLFSFVRRSPVFWGVVMVGYPLLSVYPQELIFRAYFFHRYQALFGAGWAMIVASALAFGFVHIDLGNWLSVILSMAGGFLFALTYRQTGSLLLASIEHAFFGNFIFTIGLGQFFYHGTRLKTG